jgi:hypothetical protein
MNSSTEKVKKIFDERKELFIAKNADYGNSWKVTGEILHHIFYKNPPKLETANDYIAFGVITRKLDKIIRYLNLRFRAERADIPESVTETIGDDGVYSFMLQSLDEE